MLICGIRVHYPYDTAPKIQRSAQEFVYRIQKGNVPAVNEVILHEGFKMIAPSDVRSLNSLTCRTVQIMSRVTGKQKKRKNPEGLPFPPLLGALNFTPAGVERISTDVHKSRSSTKQQANQQLHTRNPRNNKELACCSFCWLDFICYLEVGDLRETTARERHNTNVADASTPQLYRKGGTFAYMRDTGTLSLRHCPHSSAACKANSVNYSTSP